MKAKLTLNTFEAQDLFNLIDSVAQWHKGNKDRKDMEDDEVDLKETYERWRETCVRFGTKAPSDNG